MDIFEMEMDEGYGPTKPNKKATRPTPLKKGTRKKRDAKVKKDKMARVADIKEKQEYKSLYRDVGKALKSHIRVKSPIQVDQDRAFKVIEKHNLNLKKSPLAVSGRKTLATIPPRTKLIISSGQDLPTDAQAFAYDNDPTSRMAPYQYHNFMAAKKKQDKLRKLRMLQHQQMRAKAAEAGDSIDNFAEMSLQRKEYQKMKMRERQARTKKSGGKRRRKKKTRKRKGKGKGKGEKYGNLKFREIKKPTFEPTNIERVYEIDVDAMIKDERKSQQVLNKYNKTVQEWKKTPFYKRKKKNELADLANQLEFQLRNRQAREMDDSLIQTTNPEKQHYAKLGKDKDGNIIIPKGFIVSSNTKPESKTRKKGMQVLRMRAAAQAPRFGGRRSRKKRKKLMCPKNCCGVPVDDCGCPVSCPHCNCPEIKRLRKQLKKTRKKCVKKKKRKKKTRRRKK